MLISIETSTVMGIKLFNSPNQINTTKQSKTLQLGKCVFKDVNFDRNKCSIGIKLHNSTN